MSGLSERDVERYSRQIVLPEVGGRGQGRLRAAAVRVAGGGTVAEWGALYLAAAGIGRIELAAGGSGSLAGRLRRLDPAIEVLDTGGREGGGRPEVVVDATAAGWGDPAVNAAALAARRPIIVVRVAGGELWLGAFAPFRPGQPCPLCVAPRELRPEADPPPPWAALAGSLACVEALRILLDGPRGHEGRWRRWHLPSLREVEGTPAVIHPAGCAACAAARSAA